MQKVKPKTPYATYILITLNIILYIAALNSGGNKDLNSLDSLGALIPQKVLFGEWWRIVNANFLHFGFLHLSTNMLSLWFLGRLVESSVGSGKYLLVYLISGIGSMLSCTYVYTQLGNNNIVLIGASSAIMGLVGTILVIAFRTWLNQKTLLNAKRLGVVLLVIGLQFVLDSIIPQISFYSHFFGLIIGSLVSAIVLLSKPNFT